MACAQCSTLAYILTVVSAPLQETTFPGSPVSAVVPDRTQSSTGSCVLVDRFPTGILCLK